MKILNCRNCGNRKIEKLFSLGDLCYSGFFPKKKTTNVQRKNLTLVKCKSCHLVQLNEKFNPKKLYNMSYGYRTGINKTMTNHVKQIVKETSKLVKLKKNNFVLDIASNDATLLNFYPKKNYIEKGSSYAVLRGDYCGEIFVFFRQDEDTLFFVSLPKMNVRKVNVVKFDIGVRDGILDFINIIPKNIYKVIECHGKNNISGKYLK